MESKLYKHIKTGKMYELVQEEFMFKDWERNSNEPYELRATLKHAEPTLEWRKGLVLYKALYDNSDGPFFARLPEDFYTNFEQVEWSTVN